MSAPVLWIILPLGLSTVLFGLRKWKRFILIAGIVISLGLAWIAWQIPVGEEFALPLLGSFSLTDTLNVLGRRFVVGEEMRPLLTLVYLSMAFWFGGAFLARAGQMFVPFGLATAALMTATLAVEPFLYAALFIEVAALISVPLLNPPGQNAGKGVLRFLTFQTLGMPFILFTGWLLSGVETSPGDTELIQQVAVLLALGFAFLMAVFPFNTWIPMLAEEAHPYAAAFVLFMQPLMISLFALEFLERYEWLRIFPGVLLTLKYVGALMVVTGGVWAAFQRHLGRIMGYAAMMEIGLTLLALSLIDSTGPDSPQLGIFFIQLLPRVLSLALWAVALAFLQAAAGQRLYEQPGAQEGEISRPTGAWLEFPNVRGLGRQLPLAAAGLLLANLTLTGFPVLAGFPVRVALWSSLAEQEPPIALAALLGSAGLMAAGLRTMAVLLIGAGQGDWQPAESRSQAALLLLGSLALFVIGLLPQYFLPALADLANIVNIFGS